MEPSNVTPIGVEPIDPEISQMARRSTALMSAREALLPQRGPMTGAAAPPTDDLLRVAQWILTGRDPGSQAGTHTPFVRQWPVPLQPDDPDPELSE